MPRLLAAWWRFLNRFRWPLLILTLVVNVLTGCGPSETRESSTDLYVHTDKLTGCQYLSARGSNRVLTPRMGADGKQVCGSKP